MIQGMSYLQLYYNKACTRELEKDVDGNYIYNSRNISNNAIMPLVINLWCKNNGSHTAYDITLELISSDLTPTMPPSVPKIYSMEVIKLPVLVNIASGDKKQHTITMRFVYDSI